MNERIVKIQDYEKRLKRAGDGFLYNIFEPYREIGFFYGSKNLSGSDCMKIFNTIGINIEVIYLMAISNGLDGIDINEFMHLLDEQEKRSRNMKQC